MRKKLKLWAVDSASRGILHFSICSAMLLLLPSYATASPGPEFDAAKLPAPVNRPIDFNKDIKPLLEARCLKCHSDERPKSGFRLTSREAALKGGSRGVDLIPGKSEESALVYYVARLVPEMEMPPEDKGIPLTSEEVAVVRAWIDQGLQWEASGEHSTDMQLTGLAGGTSVHGNSSKYRELTWQPEGWNGGLESFDFQYRDQQGTKLSGSGHFLRDDYSILMSVEKNDLGFTRFGWDQFRKYYSDTGGYDPGLGIPAISLNQDLHLDTGRAWVDFGLTLPKLPRIVLGYEYQYRDGQKSTLQWGPVINNGQIRNVYPAAKNLSEDTHILKFQLEYEFAGIFIEDNFRGEWNDSSANRANDASYSFSTGAMAVTKADETQKYFQGANTLHLEKQLTDWFFASGGYLYSKLNSDATMNVNTFNPAVMDASLVAPGWHSTSIELERETHVFSVAGAFQPVKTLTLSLGTQNEWSRQQGLGFAGVDVSGAFSPLPIAVEPERVQSDYDRALFSQVVDLRFTGVPYTTFFGSGRFAQESVGVFEQEEGGLTPFLRQADTTSHMEEFSGGFNTSPWRPIEWSARYKYSDKETDYDNFQKESFGRVYPGYPGFIQWRDVVSQQVDTRLAWNAASWLKLGFAYTWSDSTYRNKTGPVDDPISGVTGGISPGGTLICGNCQMHTPSVNLNITPWQRLVLSATCSYQNASTVTFTHDSPSVAPYRGDIFTALSSITFLLSQKTDLFGAYSWSSADFEQQVNDGLPLGIKYHQQTVSAGARWRASRNTIVSLEYRFMKYDEPTSGGANDFTANGAFATLAWRLP